MTVIGGSQATLRPLLRLSLILLAALVVAGCGPVGDDGDRPVQLRVTADYGTTKGDEITAVSKSGNGTVLGVLQANEPVALGPGGRLETVAGIKAGPGQAWAAYINGVRLTDRITKRKVKQGDRVWLDLQAASVSAPAAVGSFPAPFEAGYDGKARLPIRIECTEPGSKGCDEVSTQLAKTGVVAAEGGLGTSLSKESIRVLVGLYANLRNDQTAMQLELGPDATGVYAAPSPDGRTIRVLDKAGNTVRTLGPGSGLVAAIRYEGSQPTWIVTATDAAGLLAAATALQEGDLGGHFALAISNGEAVDLPSP